MNKSVHKEKRMTIKLYYASQAVKKHNSILNISKPDPDPRKASTKHEEICWILGRL